MLLVKDGVFQHCLPLSLTCKISEFSSRKVQLLVMLIKVGLEVRVCS